MRTSKTAILILSTLFATAALAESNAKQSFDALKSLNGSWQGKAPDGKPIEVSNRTTAGGSTIMSEIKGAREDMISMIHLDGDRLLLTHYCEAGNQPRMQASVSPDGKTFAFDFVDGTNLAVSQKGHMQRAVFTVLDASHHTEEWDFIQDGKVMKETFDLQRVK